jgi:hypothetical protein
MLPEKVLVRWMRREVVLLEKQLNWIIASFQMLSHPPSICLRT